MPKKQTANDPTGRWCAYRWRLQSKREQTSGKRHLQPGAEIGETWKIIRYCNKKKCSTKNSSQFCGAGISQNRNPDFISSSISLSFPLSAFNLVFCNPFWVGCTTPAIQSDRGGGGSENHLVFVSLDSCDRRGEDAGVFIYTFALFLDGWMNWWMDELMTG